MGMFSSDDAPSAPVFAAPPPPPEFQGFIDRIAGVEMVEQVNTNTGKKSRVFQRLPRTAQEQALFQKGDSLLNKALGNIDTLYKYDPNAVADYQPLANTMTEISQETSQALGQALNIGNIDEYVNAFKTSQLEALERNYAHSMNIAEEEEAQRGLKGSSVAAGYKALMAESKDRARREIDANAGIYSRQLRSQDQQFNQNVLQMGELTRDKRLALAQQQYALRNQDLQNREVLRQQALNENANIAQMGAGMLADDYNKAAGSMAPQLAVQNHQFQGVDQMNRYNAGIQSQLANYNTSFHAYQNKPPSFGDTLLQMGGTAIGYGLGGPVGGFGSNLLMGKR